MRWTSKLFLIASLAIAVVLCTLHDGRADAKDADASSTPRRLITAFLAAGDADDWQSAANLVGPTGGHAVKSEQVLERARELYYLLERRSWIRLDSISDEPNGTPEDGEFTEKIGVVRLSDGEFAIVLDRSRTTPPHWSFSSDTLARVPAVYAERGPSFLETRVPTSLRISALGLQAWQWIGLPVAILLAILGSRAVAYVLSAIGRAAAKRTKAQWDDQLVAAAHGPVRLFLGCVLYGLLAYTLGLPANFRTFAFHVLLTLAIVAMIWMALRVVDVIADLFERSSFSSQAVAPPRSGSDASAAVATVELRARGVRTRVQVLRRVLGVALIGIGVALVLTQFEVVRSVGVSLLASAGVAGVIIGLAAQRTIGSLLAGIQLSITQPVRIGDTVTIETEYGVIEDITLTYAILKCWDERRLIIPITRFLEQPFQNLTKVASGQLGTVMLYASWTLPITKLRAEVDRLLKESKLWDGRIKRVHVTESKEQSIEVRILVSVANPADLFELRAWLRERLVSWLQTHEDGVHLPRTRQETINAAAPAQQPS